MPMRVTIRRWNPEIGRRSRRAPALTFMPSSLLPGQRRQGPLCQCIQCQNAVLRKIVILRSEEKLLASPHSVHVELQNSRDRSVHLARKCFGGTNLGNKTDLERARRRERFTKQHQRKRMPWQSVSTEIRHDRRRSKSMPHFRKTQRGALGNQSKVANNRQPHSESKCVALHL